VSVLGCTRESPQITYDRIKNEIDRGQFDVALKHVDHSIQGRATDDEWGWRFRILKARILVWRKQPNEALELLNQDVPPSLASTEIPEQRKVFQGLALRSAQRFAEARRAFDDADTMAVHLSPLIRCQLLIAKGALEINEKNFGRAKENYQTALTLARQQQLPLAELSVLTDLGSLAPSEERFDEAIDINRSALDLSNTLRSEGYRATILGNMAWSYSELGDFDSSLDFFKQGAEASKNSGLPVLAAYWLTGIANSEIALHDYAAAEKLAEDTLLQAEKFKNAQTIVECQNILTRTALRTNRLDDAEKHNQAALQLERSGADHFGLPDSLILAGQIATAKQRYSEAEQRFREVLDEKTIDTPLLWQAQAGLAAVRDGQGRPAEAEDFYKIAIATIENARNSVEHEDLRLSFLSSGIAVYGDYIDFLIRHGRPDDALRQADLSRARTLAEGLSTAPGAKSPAPGNTAILGGSDSRAPRSTAFQAVPLHPQQLAERLHATLLFYWLGEKQSYLWAVSPTKTECFKLPPAAEIDTLVKTYREATLKSADLLATSTATGEKLYATLVEPAKLLFPRGSRVIILPDGSLNGLNFETLIVSQPTQHFWIEDVTLTTANSLSMLAKSAAPGLCRGRPSGGSGVYTYKPPTDKSAAACNLLLIGDAVPVPEFGALPQAKDEIAKLSHRFPSQRSAVLQGASATPTAYLSSHPDRYSYLHFVTHGTASRARPLESAVILSKEPGGDTYKLYARDIVTHPLKAELVTISACNGSGTRAYSGEGLVGLSWAFLRAGAHNVIGALWEVSDVSTPNLMDQMYAELASGKDPATALRNAKLSLLHQHNVFAKPFYWAPFQLYSGS
jgi:CHAT domain-containing protein/tetratricopeptide (TPR) repeat protein